MKTLTLTLSFLFTLTLSHAQFNATVYDIQASDMVYVSEVDRIYFIGAANGIHADQLCIFNPDNGEVEQCYPVNDNPMLMAISNDEQYIYIGLRGVGNIVRFDRATEEIDQVINLGFNGPWGTLFADDIEVAPDDPNTIVVSKRSYTIGDHSGVSAYRYGGLLPNQISLNYDCKSIAFSDNNTLIGVGDELEQIKIDENGLILEETFTNPIDLGGPIEIQDGILYAIGGSTLTGAEGNWDYPYILGQFELPLHNGSAFEPALDADRIFYISNPEHNSKGFSILSIFEKSTFELLEEKEIPMGYKDYVKELIRLGTDNKLGLLTRKIVNDSQNDGLAPGRDIIILENVPVSTNEVSNLNISHKYHIFPNPTSDHIQIESLSNEIFSSSSRITMMDYTGQVIGTWSSIRLDAPFSISMDDYVSGIYFIQIMNEEHEVVGFKKVVKE